MKENPEVKKIIKALERRYGIPSFDGFSEPLDELIFTILSQNTNDINRDRAWKKLKDTFPHWESVLNTTPEKLASVIRVAGLAQEKSKNILSILKKLKKEYKKLSLKFLKDYDREKARDFLLSFRGVGPKTAACVLLFSLKKPAFPVDTHIFRVTKRLGLIEGRITMEKAHKVMEKVVPSQKYHSFHINLIRHGRAICHPRAPECTICVINRYCEYFKKSPSGLAPISIPTSS